MHQPLTLRRPLDAGERFFWLLDRVSGMNFVVFAEIGARLDRDDLARALAAAQHAHPLLRVHVAHRAPDQLWFEPDDTALHLTEIAVDGGSWRQPIEAELSHRFELAEAPLVRCHYLAFIDGARSVLALTFHHAVADGRSGTALLREILAYLAQPQQPHFQTGAVHPPMHAAFAERYQWHRQPHAAAAVHEARKAEFKRYGRPRALPWLTQQADARQPRFVRIVLDRAQSTRLIEQCKKQGATVHGILGAAQLAALHRSTGEAAPQTLNLGSPVDMRPYLAADIPATGLGLYVTLLHANYRVDAAQELWPLAREISADIKRQMQRGDGHLLFAQIRPDAYAPTAPGIADFSAAMLASPQSAMISNIGTVAAADPLVPVESMSFVLCPMPYQIVFAAVATYDGQLVINQAYDAARLDDDQAAQLAQWMRQALSEAGNG